MYLWIGDNIPNRDLEKGDIGVYTRRGFGVRILFEDSFEGELTGSILFRTAPGRSH